MCGMIGQIAGAGVSGYGSYVSAQASLKAGKYQERLLRYQATQAAQRARQRVLAGDSEAQQVSLESRQRRAAAATAYAANGILLDGAPGSAPAMFDANAAAQAALDQQRILDNASSEAWAFSAEKEMLMTQGRFARYAGRQAATSALIQGIGQQASYASGMYSSGMSAGGK